MMSPMLYALLKLVRATPTPESVNGKTTNDHLGWIAFVQPFVEGRRRGYVIAQDALMRFPEDMQG